MASVMRGVVCMRLRKLPDVLPSRRRGRDALGALVNDFAEFFSTSASRGFCVLVSSNARIYVQDGLRDAAACMRLRKLPDVLPSRRRGRDALGALVNDFAEFFSTSASRGFCVLVSSNARMTKAARHRRHRATPLHRGRSTRAAENCGGRGKRQTRRITSKPDEASDNYDCVPPRPVNWD
eukprot:CAMPEP_0172650878 /NCGR_PEP_ID=MMETSP1068-20121228/242519_1 /TAXON_ID=35684 /ORGANISM="Pseudopedinella elastica, Strain CCMP716" /LENGTH=179 /DNA_ID=CAMNT_0013465253 /DNA_START=541 /DNA_END=1079 /DNA_ORIENTATION=-